MGDLKAGVEGPEAFAMLVALDEILEECIEGGSVGRGESKARSLGDWTLEAGPELGLEGRRSSVGTFVVREESFCSMGSFAAPTVALILLYNPDNPP